MKTYFTGVPCRNGHISERLVRNKNCLKCQRISQKKWRTKNSEKEKIRKKIWVENNKERMALHQKRWQKNNPQKNREKSKKWFHKNKEKAREKSRVWAKENKFKRKEWRVKNRSLLNSHTANRRARKLKATPEWADHDLIYDIYLEAKYFNMHVDHIVPLKHPSVCGLHVEHNLQLLTPEENSKKNNHFYG